MSINTSWQELYDIAKSLVKPKRLSPLVTAGEVASAILTIDGNIYTGVCIDTASSLGMCAERNAITTMITHGESQIIKLVAVMEDGSVGSPCGACREFLMQLDKNSGEMEILTDLHTLTTIKLKELIPDWWGSSFYK